MKYLICKSGYQSVRKHQRESSILIPYPNIVPHINFHPFSTKFNDVNNIKVKTLEVVKIVKVQICLCAKC